MKKTNNNHTFESICDNAPTHIRYYIEHSKGVPQTLKWHPEGDLYTHIRVVFNRAKRTGDINFMLAAILHDLGKVDVTVKHPTIADKWTSKTHERISARITRENKEWIESLGADFEIVHYLVEQHMRIKQLDEMRDAKKKTTMEHPFYPYLEQFTEMDDMLIDFTNDLK
jgi:hypothetical protein